MTKKIGRPRFDLSEELATRIIDLCLGGKTDVEIAEEVGIGITTLKKLKGRHPDFGSALKDAKEFANDAVEASLFECAMAGNTTAQIFWLKNRRPHEWRDVHKVQVEGSVRLELPSPTEAKAILEADYALLPAEDVTVPDLDEEKPSE